MLPDVPEGAILSEGFDASNVRLNPDELFGKGASA